jgi:hypothetical protein
VILRDGIAGPSSGTRLVRSRCRPRRRRGRPGGSRASGAAHSSSDYDLGLYFRENAGLDVERLLEAVKGLVDDFGAAAVTEVGGWGPWIVGGGWLSIAGNKVDLLYRPIESVEKVILDCRDGRISMDYQLLFALNRRYLINEKGALEVAARLPLTISRLSERTGNVWRAVGLCALDAALAELKSADRELARLSAATP